MRKTELASSLGLIHCQRKASLYVCLELWLRSTHERMHCQSNYVKRHRKNVQKKLERLLVRGPVAAIRLRVSRQ